MIRKKLPTIKYLFVIGLVVALAIPVYSFANSPEETLKQYQEEQQGDREKALEKKKEEINEIDEKIGNYQKGIQEKQSEISNLSEEIDGLKNDISEAEVAIEETTNQIQSLGDQIKNKEKEIALIQGDINYHKDLISSFLRLIYERDQRSGIELLLAEEKFSDFFNEVNSSLVLEEKLKNTLTELKNDQEQVDHEKAMLEKENLKSNQYRQLQEIQKSSLAGQKIKREDLVSSKAHEAGLYQQLISDAESAKNELQQDVYRLQFGNVSKDFTFDEAVRIAKGVSDLTNVRPAFLLAVLKQESNLGKNTGTAHYLDAYTCNGKRSQDDPWIAKNIKYFLEITKDLGRDPEKTLVSACPGYGTGGAMGPAQFMPATWMGYSDQVANTTGNNPPDPWNVVDAMTAMGIKLGRGGANQGTREGEFNSALIYFSGGINHQYDWYAESILNLSDEYETKIKGSN